MSAKDHAAIEGRTVTQAHADYCTEHGHATWTEDGDDMGSCPRCGESTETHLYLFSDEERDGTVRTYRITARDWNAAQREYYRRSTESAVLFSWVQLEDVDPTPRYQDEENVCRQDVEGYSATIMGQFCGISVAELNARHSAGVHFALPISGDATLIAVGR